MTSRTFLPPLRRTRVPFGALRNIALLEYETRPITLLNALQIDNLLEERAQIRQNYNERMEALHQEYTNTLRTYSILRRERDELQRRQHEALESSYNRANHESHQYIYVEGEFRAAQNESSDTYSRAIPQKSLWVETMSTKHRSDAEALVTNNEACCICYEPYERVQRIVFTQCGHHVCVECKTNMENFSLTKYCPLCKTAPM